MTALLLGVIGHGADCYIYIHTFQNNNVTAVNAAVSVAPSTRSLSESCMLFVYKHTRVQYALTQVPFKLLHTYR